MKELSSRQMCIMVFICTCAPKLLMFPSLLINATGNALWLTLLIMLLIDSCFFLIVFALIKTYPELNYKQILEKFLGKTVTKITMIFLAVLLCLKASFLIRECFEFYTETAYVDLSWTMFLVPLVIAMVYLSIQRIRVLGRSGEILIYFIALSILVSFLFSVPNFDFTSFFPLFPDGVHNCLTSCFNYAFWFGDFLILFLCMGEIQYNKGSLKKIYLSYFVSSVIVIIVCMMHYSIFGIIAPTFKTSIIDITEYIPRISTSGRFTWLGIFLWPVAIIYTIYAYESLAVKCVQNCFSFQSKYNGLIGSCVLAISCGFLICSVFSEVVFIKYILSFYKYFVVVAQYLVFLFLPLAIVFNRKKEKKYGKSFV